MFGSFGEKPWPGVAVFESICGERASQVSDNALLLQARCSAKRISRERRYQRMKHCLASSASVDELLRSPLVVQCSMICNLWSVYILCRNRVS